MNGNDAIPLSARPEDGDIVHMLAAFSGADTDTIEHQLRSGKTPWALAAELGVLGRLRDELLERVFAYLDVMVEERQLSREEADEMIAHFEMNVPVAQER